MSDNMQVYGLTYSIGDIESLAKVIRMTADEYQRASTHEEREQKALALYSALESYVPEIQKRMESVKGELPATLDTLGKIANYRPGE